MKIRAEIGARGCLSFSQIKYCPILFGKVHQAEQSMPYKPNSHTSTANKYAENVRQT